MLPLYTAAASCRTPRYPSASGVDSGLRAIFSQRLLEVERVSARKKLTATEKELSDVIKEHVTNNEAVRKTLLERGIRPERLPDAEDVKK